MLKPIKLIFLGTPEISKYCLEGLFNDQRFLVVGVISQPDKPAGRKLKLKSSSVKSFAIKNEIPCIMPKSIKSEEVLNIVKSWNADAAVVIAYGQIIHRDLLEIFGSKIVNIHASLLPLWRGAAPIQRAIQNGDKFSGLCLQIVTPALDAGDIIAERVLVIDEDITSLEYLEKLKPLAFDLLACEFIDYLEGKIHPQSQNPEKVTYASKIEKEESQIIWKSSALQIKNKMRAFTMGPGVFAYLFGKKIKFHDLEVIDFEKETSPGLVLSIEKNFFTIGTGKGVLKVLKLQLENKSKILTKDFLTGNNLKVGDCFE